VPVDAANGRPSLLTWVRLIWPLACVSCKRLVLAEVHCLGILPDCERCTPVHIGDSLSDKWVISYFWHKEAEPTTAVSGPVAAVSGIRGSPEGMTISKLLVLTRNRMSRAKTCLLIY